MKLNMFDIVNINLSANTVHSEQSGIRPCIIIQNDIGNQYSPTVIVMPLTAELKKQYLPTHCLIKRSLHNGLNQDSMVLGEQVRVVDKSRISERIGHVYDEDEKNNIIHVYLANITGKKKYMPFWKQTLIAFCGLIKEGIRI